MFSEINHSESDDRLERSPSMKSNDEGVDQQPSVSDVPVNQQSLTVIKIGGSTLGSHDTTLMDLVELQKKGKNFVSFLLSAQFFVPFAALKVGKLLSWKLNTCHQK